MATAQENPLLEGLRLRRTPDPCILVIFGASGDLTKRKLFPALYSLAFRRLLPERFAVVGTARTEETRVGDVADALVGEGERLADLVQDSPADELLEGARRASFPEIARALKEGEHEFASDRGRNRDEVLGLVGQPLQALLDESPHALRQRAMTTRVELESLPQSANHFDGNERVAFARQPDLLGARPGDRFVDGARQRDGFVARQR